MSEFPALPTCNIFICARTKRAQFLCQPVKHLSCIFIILKCNIWPSTCPVSPSDPCIAHITCAIQYTSTMPCYGSCMTHIVMHSIFTECNNQCIKPLVRLGHPRVTKPVCPPSPPPTIPEPTTPSDPLQLSSIAEHVVLVP